MPGTIQYSTKPGMPSYCRLVVYKIASPYSIQTNLLLRGFSYISLCFLRYWDLLEMRYYWYCTTAYIYVTLSVWWPILKLKIVLMLFQKVHTCLHVFWCFIFIDAYLCLNWQISTVVVTNLVTLFFILE